MHSCFLKYQLQPFQIQAIIHLSSSFKVNEPIMSPIAKHNVQNLLVTLIIWLRNKPPYTSKIDHPILQKNDIDWKWGISYITTFFLKL